MGALRQATEPASEGEATASAPGPDHAAGRAAIFLLAFGVLLLEIACTRIFSFSLTTSPTWPSASRCSASGHRAPRSRRRDGSPAGVPKRLMPEGMLAAAAGVTV